ncbi:MAG: sodium:proton antiporter NhaD [Flavobacterium sp.]|nr:sodium:proton antiporter NhaD [Flavobacterium sp.]
MATVIVLIFIFGYLAITLEHPLKIDKTVPALLTASIMWGFLAIGFNLGWFSVIDTNGLVYNVFNSDKVIQTEGFHSVLAHHFAATAEILIFLIGAMTIVEVIDLHQGFVFFKTFIKTKSKIKLLWIIGFVGFFLSAIIDNLTATIVIISILRKLIINKQERIWFVSMIVIATNAGGAWSPIGDVTTTMLWIANKLSASGLIEFVILPSIVCFVVPFFIASKLKIFQGNIEFSETESNVDNKILSSNKMLIIGLSAIVFVPIFKMITHLPPYLGMIFSLGIVWLCSEFIHPEENFDKSNRNFSVPNALSRIEISSILFFLGILMSVACLESLVFGTVDNSQVGTLRFAAQHLSIAVPNQNIVIVLLGFLSAIVDNVPLVAATIGMFTQEIDNPIWHFIAYCSGTGGSMLIIGSAAGVAAMGMEKIDFVWYFKKISWMAFLGFISGAIVFVAIEMFR